MVAKEINSDGARLLAAGVIIRAAEDYLLLRQHGCAKDFQPIGLPEDRSVKWPQHMPEVFDCCNFFRDGRLREWLELANLRMSPERIRHELNTGSLAQFRANHDLLAYGWARADRFPERQETFAPNQDAETQETEPTN